MAFLHGERDAEAVLIAVRAAGGNDHHGWVAGVLSSCRMEMVCMLLGLVPSFVTSVHLWRRTDVGYAQFTWWAMVILVPWAGPLTYIACTSMTPIAAPLLIVIGSWLLYAYCAGPGGEIIRTRTWQRANVVDFDSGGTYEFHTVSQLRPRYTYVYEGKRFTGRFASMKLRHIFQEFIVANSQSNQARAAC